MKTVHKYTLDPGETHYDLPDSSKILHVADQFGDVCIWVEVNTDAPVKQRRIEVFGTGHEVSPELTYLGTAHCHGGSLILHVYGEPGL